MRDQEPYVPQATNPEDVDRLEQVLARAAAIYAERERAYGGQWKKYGWRGAIYNARRKVERAFTTLWNAEPRAEVTFHPDETTTQKPGVFADPIDVDDLLDTINYCAMAIMQVEDGNRDGAGSWWQ